MELQSSSSGGLPEVQQATTLDDSEEPSLLHGLLGQSSGQIAGISPKQRRFLLAGSGLWLVSTTVSAIAVIARGRKNGYKPPMLIPASLTESMLLICLVLLLLCPWSVTVWHQIRPSLGTWSRCDRLAALAIFVCTIPLVFGEVFARHLPTSDLLLAFTTACALAVLVTVAGLFAKSSSTLLDMVSCNTARWEKTIGHLAFVALAIASLWTGFSDAVVNVVEVAIPGLAHDADGYSICMISDLHAGPITGQKTLQMLIDNIKSASCDTVVLNGDIAEGTVAERAGEMKTLLQLVNTTPDGEYYVPGNHEFYNWDEPEDGRGGAVDWANWWDSHGIKSLNNTHVELPRKGRPALTLAGVDDILGRPNLSLSLSGRHDVSLPVVLMAHRPVPHISNAARSGVSLQISGHTHGGQLWPAQMLTSVANGGYLSGIYRVNSTWLYVGDGSVSSYLTRLRLFTQAEVTKVVLRSASVPGRSKWKSSLRPAKIGHILGWVFVAFNVAALGCKVFRHTCKLVRGHRVASSGAAAHPEDDAA